MLVVAPLSTLNFVWAREIFATLPHRKCAVLHGSRRQREEKLRDISVDIYIINHDGLRVVERELSLRTDIDVLVLDELAVYRNNSDRSKSMRKFATRFPWVWGMTGRPMPTEVTDVWAQCKIVTPERIPTYFKQAREMLMVKVNQYKYLPKQDAVENAFNMMRPQARFSLDDVVELPDMVIPPPREIKLSDEQDKTYRKLAREFQIMVKNQTITAVNAAAAMNKLLQVSCGYVYTNNPNFVTLDSTPRQRELLDILEGVEGKVLVFVPYRHALEGLSKLLTAGRAKPETGIEHCVMHGDTRNRDFMFNEFQNTSKYKALLAHPACLCHGVTLTAARTIVWYGPIASLETYDQANARIRRVGQKEKQQIIRFQSTPVERKFYKLLADRQNIQDQLLQMFETATEDAK
jgi:SNF2 family DNA or RNA helicase